MIYPWRNALLCIVAEAQIQLFIQIARSTQARGLGLFLSRPVFSGRGKAEFRNEGHAASNRLGLRALGIGWAGMGGWGGMARSYFKMNRPLIGFDLAGRRMARGEGHSG